MPNNELSNSKLPSCPADSVLARLIAGDLAAEECLVLESHLTQCEFCRTQIETLSEVSAIEAYAGTMNTPESNSPSLRGVMERLLIESQLMSGSVNFAANPTRDVLPALQPSVRPGFIGRLGDIDVRKVIGRGGMGVVFEGEDSILNRTVAVKVLSPHLLSDADAKARFLREARAAAALTHENVVGIHSVNEADGIPYLVLQFIAGESLSARLKRDKKLGFEEVVRLGIETARGLVAAHKSGLVHRDVKPANILLESEKGTVRITDFGLAKLIDSDSITKLGSIAGTPAYMSPEQSTSDELDARSDLFSLGVVLYEASTGVSPFAAESPFVTLNNIRTHEPRSVCSLNPALPAWFGNIVERLLAKRPENRIQSALLVAESLEQRVVTERSSLAANKHTSRIRRVVAAACIAGLLIGAALYLREIEVAKSNSTNSDTLSANLPVNGFQVDTQTQTYSTLADAIGAAKNNSNITVHGDGPFATQSIVISGKGLTIRAAAGSVPRFTPVESKEATYPTFIASDSDLRLEGIEVNWPIDSQPLEINSPQLGFENTSERCAITTAGKLNVSYCQILTGRFGVCLGGGLDDVSIHNCHLISPTGIGLAWRPVVSKVSVEHCLIESKVAAIFKSAIGIADTTLVHFKSNTVISHRLFSIISVGPVRRQVELRVANNVLDSQVVASVFQLGGFRPNQEAKITDALREVIDWHDESNVYQQGVMYLAVNPFKQPFGTLPSSLNAIDKWLTFWEQTDSASVEGEIKFNEGTPDSRTSIDVIESTSGPIPAMSGADLSRIGPGIPYHSRSSP